MTYILKILIDICNDLLANIPIFEVIDSNRELMLNKRFMTFTDINHEFKSKLLNNYLEIVFNDDKLVISPYILFSNNYGIFLYDGLSEIGNDFIFKNYSQGINLLIKK